MAKSTPGKKRKKVDDEDDGDGDQAEEAQDEKPKAKKTKSVPAPRSNGKAVVKEADDHEEIADEQTHEDEGKEGAKSSDELAEINGVKPKVYLEDGAEREVSSMSRYGYHFCKDLCCLLIFSLVHPRIRSSVLGTIITGE